VTIGKLPKDIYLDFSDNNLKQRITFVNVGENVWDDETMKKIQGFTERL